MVVVSPGKIKSIPLSKQNTGVKNKIEIGQNSLIFFSRTIAEIFDRKPVKLISSI